MSLWIALLVAALGAEQQSARSQFESLKKEFDSAKVVYHDAYRKAKTDEERDAVFKKQPNRQDYMPQFFQIAEAHPDDPAAIDALLWIAAEDMFWSDGEKAMKILAEKHADGPQVAEYASQNSRYGGPFAPYEELLRAVDKHEHERDIQAAIRLTLGLYLKMTKETYDRSQVLVSIGHRGWSNDTDFQNLNRWTENGIDKLSAEVDAILESVIAEYGDVKLKNSFPESAAEIAKQQLFELRNLQIGQLAPNIEATDIAGTAFNLNDSRGKVVVLDFGSHRMCGICVALYPNLRGLVEQYKNQPFELIGINVGDDVGKLRELTQSNEVTWKLISDGKGYQGPITSRWAIDSMPTFYVIDHKGIIRDKGYHGVFEVMATLTDKILAEMKAEQRASQE